MHAFCLSPSLGLATHWWQGPIDNQTQILVLDLPLSLGNSCSHPDPNSLSCKEENFLC